MMQFISKGFLIPESKIETSLSEFKKIFVDGNKHGNRNMLFQSFVNYAETIKSVLRINVTFWINGSFVSKTLNPNDIDVVAFLDHTIVEKNQAFIKSLIFPDS